jgi:hypothetical protein
MRTMEKSSLPASTAQSELNPWPFFWVVVGAWFWYGTLHLAHMI